MNEHSNKELEQTQVKNAKLQQECEQLSSAKERLVLENQQKANELKVNRTGPLAFIYTRLTEKHPTLSNSHSRVMLLTLCIPSPALLSLSYASRNSFSHTCQVREEEVSQMRQDITKQTKMREVIQKKLHQMEDQKADVDVQREILKAQIAGVEKGTGCVFYVSATRDGIAGPRSNMVAAMLLGG